MTCLRGLFSHSWALPWDRGWSVSTPVLRVPRWMMSPVVSKISSPCKLWDRQCLMGWMGGWIARVVISSFHYLHWLFASSTQRHSRFSVPSRMLLYHVDYLWTRDSKGIAANINFFVKETSGKILELLFTILLTISFYDGIRNRGMILGLLRHSIWNMLIMLRENPL